VNRLDISPSLIHFTSGYTVEDAFRRIQTILAERKLLGSANKIKGGYQCVCFSEAPLDSLLGGLVNEHYYSRYSPFGIMVSKDWLFSLGGRPVIYETEQEYLGLAPSHGWRHVRYDLRPDHERVDFTWEREWRIRGDSLLFDPGVAQVVVLDRDWANRLWEEHNRNEDYKVVQYSHIIGSQHAEMQREQFRWTVHPLR